jgi:hypothetical protein
MRDQCGLLNTHFHNVFHNLISYEPSFFHFSCACNVLQQLSWLSMLTYQFVDLKTFFFPERINVSMPFHKTNIAKTITLLYFCLNVTLTGAI